MTSRMFGYARVSTIEQSLLRQREDLSSAGCVKIYEETTSGKKSAKRPELEKLLSEILREGDSLCVTELSRLGRDTGAVIALSNSLIEKKVGLRVLNLDVDLTTPSGKAILGIIAVIAEMERDLLRERTLSGLAAARLHGRQGGRPKSVTKRQIAKMQDMYDQRVTVGAIARDVGVSPSTVHRYIVNDTKQRALAAQATKGDD